MTPEQIAESIVLYFDVDDEEFEQNIAKDIRQAVAEEREALIKFVESIPEYEQGGDGGWYANGPKDIAKRMKELSSPSYSYLGRYSSSLSPTSCGGGGEDVS